MAGLKPTTPRGQYTDEQLIQIELANIAFADWYLARLAAVCDVLSREATTPDVRYEALQLKAVQAVSVYAIRAGASPMVQVLNLGVLIELTHMKWVSEGRALAIFGDRGKLLVAALDEMRAREHLNLLRLISQNELNAVLESARKWRSQNLEITDIELIRFDDFATELASALAPEERADLMSSLQATAKGLSETRLLGERAIHLAARFPRIMSWQLEAQTADVARRSETRTLLDNLTKMAQVAEELKKQSVQIHSSLDAFPQKLSDALAQGSMLKQALSTVNEAVVRAKVAAEQLGAVEAAVQGLDRSIVNLTQQLDQIARAYDPASVEKLAQGGTSAAAKQARPLIYLVVGCLAGLVVLQSLLRRLSNMRHSK